MALDRQVVGDGLLEELDRFEELVRAHRRRRVGAPEPLRGLDRRRRRPPRRRLDGRRRRRPARRPRHARGDRARGRASGPAAPPPSWPTSAPRCARPPPACCRCSTTPPGRPGARRLRGHARRRRRGPLVRHVAARRRHPRRHRPAVRDRLGLAGAVSHVTFELRKRGWQGEVAGDPFTLVLVATGRADPSASARALRSTSTPEQAFVAVSTVRAEVRLRRVRDSSVRRACRVAVASALARSAGERGRRASGP